MKGFSFAFSPSEVAFVAAFWPFYQLNQSSSHKRRTNFYSRILQILLGVTVSFSWIDFCYFSWDRHRLLELVSFL